MKKILIADDNRDNLYMLKIILETAGMEVIEAENGKDALDKAHLNPPDLIVTDILMPVMDGYALCRQWKSDEKLKQIPFVFYTATYTDPKDEAFALGLGAERFILKPQKPDVLMKSIKEVLEENAAEKPAATKPLGEEMEFFRQHNEILFKKLEKKMLDLEMANQQVRLLEEKYRLAFEHVQDVLYTIDTDLHVTSVSPSVTTILGYEPQDLIGRSVSDLQNILTPESLQQSAVDISLALEGNTLSTTVYQFIAKDGTIKYGEVSGSPIINNGKVTGIVSVARDITERKRAEKDLRESEYKYKSLIENIPDIILTINLEGKITFASRRTKEILGYEESEMLNMAVFNFVPEEDRQRAMESFRKGMKGEKIKNLPMPMITKQGERLFFECSFSRVYKDGAVVGAQGTAVDITERMRAEAALRESELTYQTFFETTGTTMLIVEDDMTISLANHGVEGLTGYPREEVEGKKKWSDFVEKSDLEKMIAYHKLRRIDPKLPKKSYEFRLVHRDGTQKNIIITIDMIPGTKKSVASLVDITDLKRVEEALKNSEEKYRNIFENAIEGIYQSTMDGRFITANAALARITGYDSPEELIESIKDIGTQLYVHTEDRKRFLEIRDARGFVYNFEVEFYKKDGSTFWVVVNARTVKDKRGHTLYFEGIIEDITVRKHAEKQLHQTIERLTKAVVTTIRVLVSAVESRDPYTAGHQKRVAHIARAIATEMGLAQDKIEGIHMAGSIHDIGKLSIPAEILSRPRKLTAVEFSLIKEHPQIGCDMLKDVDSPWPLAKIVCQHHERMDGSGYPKNLKGDEILLEARIMAVADVVESMASHRPYRPALGIDAALEEIEKNKGILYDETAADACLRLFREKGFQLT